MATTHGLELEANPVFDALMDGVDFTFPDVDISGPEYEIPGGDDSELYKPVDKIDDADLVTTFTSLMNAFKVQLQQEYEKNRITGAEYSKTYTALVAGAMSNATQFLLGRDQAYWAAVQAQIGAVTAKVQLVTAKVQLTAVKMEALTQQATYALTKAKIATESVAYGQAVYNLDRMAPLQLAAAGLQNTLLGSQNLMVLEQKEAQRAQTLDTRTDGSVVAGSVGKQKALYQQQIVSYERDAEVKSATLFTNAWITMKTIDEGLTAPTNFSNDSINTVLQTIKTNNQLG